MSQHLRARLQAQAETYAAKATQLSELLEEAAAFLQAQPGKIETRVCEHQSGGVLSFSKYLGDWKLTIAFEYDDREDDFYVVTEAPVAIKAQAAQLLPQLVEELFESQQSQLNEVEDGLQCLAAIPFLNVELDGEPGKTDAPRVPKKRGGKSS